MYIPVPILGYACDRVGPGPLALFAAFFGGGGYALAAAVFHRGAAEVAMGSRGAVTGMICAFVAIGMGTAGMYIAAITTCAKNFGKGKYRGLMLVAPIACFGLSAMMLSQIGSKVLCERFEDGTKGDVDVFKFFVFLSSIFAAFGVLGFFTLVIIDEEDLIDEAIEELERSGLLTGSEVFRRRGGERGGYGAIDQIAVGGDAASMAKDDEDENAQLKKTFLLNAETRRFLTDHTMWWFTAGFWLINGPGEAFINNLGTVIGTLYSADDHGKRTTAATHVSIMAAVSTLARLLTACLSDLLSPAPQSQHVQIGGPSGTTAGSLDTRRRPFTVSRVVIFMLAALTQSFGTGFLAAGGAQGHGDRFWIVSGFVGAGYGAVFSITPIIITMIWGVENFGTNFGIIALTPAVGSTMWGLIYSAAYQAGANMNPPVLSADGSIEDDIFCHGKQCYSGTFWAMTTATWVGVLMVLWAWKGKNGWAQRGVVI